MKISSCLRCKHDKTRPLQHTATYYNILQQTATDGNTLYPSWWYFHFPDMSTTCDVLYNALQQTATDCNRLQQTVSIRMTYSFPRCKRDMPYALQQTATHCNRLQHTAVLTFAKGHENSSSHRYDLALLTSRVDPQCLIYNTLTHSHTYTHMDRLPRARRRIAQRECGGHCITWYMYVHTYTYMRIYIHTHTANRLIHICISIRT